MSTPILPPYFGSYEEIVNALLHNPSLGSGRGGHPFRVRAEAVELNPQPLPPREKAEFSPWNNAAVHYLATVVSMQELAQSVTDQGARQALSQNAENAIREFIDDYCGTPPRRIPWPWPGPPPWVNALAAELVSVANTQTGAMREGLMNIAGRITQAGLQAAKAIAVSA